MKLLATHGRICEANRRGGDSYLGKELEMWRDIEDWSWKMEWKRGVRIGTAEVGWMGRAGRTIAQRM